MQKRRLLPGLLAVTCVLASTQALQQLFVLRAWDPHEPWRVLTFHLAHASPAHLTANLLGVAALALLWPPLRLPPARHVLAIAFGCGFGTQLTLQHEFVLGASGLLHGLLTYFAIIGSTHSEVRVRAIGLGLLLGAKLLFEQRIGPLPGSETLTTLSIATENHLAGAGSGALVAVAALLTAAVRRLLRASKRLRQGNGAMRGDDYAPGARNPLECGIASRFW